MSEPAVKLCEICKKTEPYDGLRVCQECMGEKPVIQYQECKVCRQAKPESEMHRARKGWCNKCVGYDLQAKKRTKIKPVLQIEEFEPEDQNVLIIDFTKHLEVLENLKGLAESELRSPENQVLYWLIKNMR